MREKSANRSAKSTERTAAPEVVSAGLVAALASDSSSDAAVAWFDSNDPRKRMLGRIVLAGVWLYVAALWLLALDQTFRWGIFGPAVPPVP